MLIIERQEKLLEILRDRKVAQLEELARELDVSSSTVRRDLEVLEHQGLVRRTHGGAVYQQPRENGATPSLSALDARMAENVEAKRAIGHCAASLVQPGMTILLDGGSTVVYAAQQIIARPLQVVTNSLSIANLFAEDEQVELLVIGGSLYPRSGVLVGPIATACLADLHADLMMFSAAGVSDDSAFNMNLAMVEAEQAMLRQAARSIMLTDSSKLGRKSLVRVCSLDEVTQIVTDSGVDLAWRDRLGSRLLIA